MKKLILILSLLLFISCQNKPTEEEKRVMLITEKVQCGNLLQSIKNQLIDAKLVVRKSGNSRLDVEVIKVIENITDLKNSYLEHQSKNNLITYSDSILQRYSNINKYSNGVNNGISSYLHWDKKNPNPDSETNFNNILIDKSKVYQETKDTLDHIQLFFWTLKAEQKLLDHYYQRIGDGGIRCYFSSNFSAYLNSSKIKTGDPVYLIIRSSLARECNGDSYVFKATDFYLEHKQSKERIPVDPVRIGNQYLIQAKPTKKGLHEFKGLLIVNGLEREPESEKFDTVNSTFEFKVN